MTKKKTEKKLATVYLDHPTTLADRGTVRDRARTQSKRQKGEREGSGACGAAEGRRGGGGRRSGR